MRKGREQMYCNEVQAMKTIPVQPGATVMGDLSENGILRFERAGHSMMGKPNVHIKDGALVLQYDDGTVVNVQV